MKEAERFSLDLLDRDDPFEIDQQMSHLFKHAMLSVDDVYDVWACDPLFYEADSSRGAAEWLMVAEVPGGDVLVVPLARSNRGDVTRARPIGVYRAPIELERRYKEER